MSRGAVTSDHLLATLCAQLDATVAVYDRQGIQRQHVATSAPESADAAQIGRPLSDLPGLSPEDAARGVAAIGQAIATASVQTVRFDRQQPGGVATVEVTISPLDDEHALWVARDVTELQRLKTAALLLESAPDPIGFTDLAGRLVYTNTAHRRQFQIDDDDLVTLVDVVAPHEHERLQADILPQLFQAGEWQGELAFQRRDGSTFPAFASAFVVGDGITQYGTAGIVRDITAQVQADQERLALQEQIINAQQAALRELSTPLIPLAEGVLAMPLVGSINTERADLIMETLLDGIVEQQATVAILDITGVRVVDTQIAQALVRIAQAATLLGAKVVLTGISAEVAQSLVHLGADLQGMTTLRNLQAGITFALGRRAS